MDQPHKKSDGAASVVYKGDLPFNLVVDGYLNSKVAHQKTETHVFHTRLRI